jgi:hypothetical protein
LKIALAPIEAYESTKSAPARCSVLTLRSSVARLMIWIDGSQAAAIERQVDVHVVVVRGDDDDRRASMPALRKTSRPAASPSTCRSGS